MSKKEFFPPEKLLASEIKNLIEQSRQQVAVVVNSAISMLYWQIGKRINDEVLQNQRAEYGKEIVHTLSAQLTAEFGKGWSEKQLRHCLRFAETFPVPILSNFLLSTLQLTLHPKKIYLQHYTKGVKFLGTVILPNRIYLQDRTINNLKSSIYDFNIEIRKTKKLQEPEKLRVQSSINSYLGIAKHYNTYNIRKQLLTEKLSAYYYNYFYISGGYCKLV